MLYGLVPSSVLRLSIAVGVLSQAACHIQLGESQTNRVTASDLQQRVPLSSPATPDADDENASALPVLILDVPGREIARGSESPGVLKVIEAHDGTLKDVQKREPAVQSAISIEIHGDSSAGLAKKSYRFELVDDKRSDRSLPLLGLPSGSDWVLHGCGADRTCLRNALAYELARDMGRYAPRTRFVELFVNDTYRGLYVLTERVRRDKDRVDLPRPATTEAEGDISGGYIFKLDLGEGGPGDRVPRDWVSPVTQWVYSYYYPRYNQITAAQKTYLRDFVSQFEQVMRGSSWNDPDAGYRRWLDVASWVDFAIVQELSLNPDAYFKSVHFQKLPRSQGDRLALGPIWDFDLAFGAAEFRDSRNTRAWAYKMNRFGGEPVPYSPPGKLPYVPAYWERLWSDSAFQQDVRCRWQELRRGPLALAQVNAQIDAWAEQLAGAQPRDGALWGNPPANEFGNEVRMLKEFIANRIAFMDASLPGKCNG